MCYLCEKQQWMKFFNFCIELQNVTEWTESVILNNFSSKTLSETTFRRVVLFKEGQPQRAVNNMVKKKISRGGSLKLEIPVIFEL